jgi:hypothetical protein
VELVDFLEWVQAEIGDGFVELVDLLFDAAEELAHVLNFIRIFGMFDRGVYNYHVGLGDDRTVVPFFSRINMAAILSQFAFNTLHCSTIPLTILLGFSSISNLSYRLRI